MGIWIDQKFGGVEANAVFRSPRTVDAIAITLPCANACEVSVPDRAIAVAERKASFDQLSIDLVEETELDGVGSVGPNGEVAPTLSESGAKCSRVGWMHPGSLPEEWPEMVVSRVTDQ